MTIGFLVTVCFDVFSVGLVALIGVATCFGFGVLSVIGLYYLFVEAAFRDEDLQLGSHFIHDTSRFPSYSALVGLVCPGFFLCSFLIAPVAGFSVSELVHRFFVTVAFWLVSTLGPGHLFLPCPYL